MEDPTFTDCAWLCIPVVQEDGKAQFLLLRSSEMGKSKDATESSSEASAECVQTIYGAQALLILSRLLTAPFPRNMRCGALRCSAPWGLRDSAFAARRSSPRGPLACAARAPPAPALSLLFLHPAPTSGTCREFHGSCALDSSQLALSPSPAVLLLSTSLFRTITHVDASADLVSPSP
eukprot:6207063-Pleurochrysis_carterae.AAC.1